MYSQWFLSRIGDDTKPDEIIQVNITSPLIQFIHYIGL